jgi:hypothetical protein
MNSTDRLWYVQLADGDVHRVTLDQLDEGFQAGHIDEKTMVLAAGASRWKALGELAGIDEGDNVAPQPVAHVAPPLLPPTLNTHRPVSVDLSDLEVLEAAGLPRRSGKRWLVAFVAFVVVLILGGIGAVVVERPSWIEPYWSRLAPQTAAVKSWIERGLPSLVRRVRGIADK